MKKLYFVLPPNFLGTEKAQAVQKLFYDYEHLNALGISLYSEKILRETLAK